MTLDSSVKHDSAQHIETHLRRLVWPILLTTVFQIAVLYHPSTTVLAILGYIVFLVVINRQTFKDHLPWHTVAGIAGIATAIVGALVAFYMLITSPSLVAVFNLVTQPIFTGICGALGGAFIYLLLQFIPSTTTEKGGDPYGTHNQHETTK